MTYPCGLRRCPATGTDLHAIRLRSAAPEPTRVDRAVRSRFVAVAARTDLAFQQCIDPACSATFSVDEVLTACPVCGNLLDVEYYWERLRPPTSFEVFEWKWMRRSDPLAFSGVWRFH